MVHTDGAVARLDEQSPCICEEFVFFGAHGPAVTLQPPLVLDLVRNMRVAVHGEPVRAQVDSRLDGLFPRFGPLFRQPVDQVYIHAAKAQFAAPSDQPARFGFGLVTVDDLLHVRVEVLHAHADPVESQRAQRFELLPCRHARVHFECNFCIPRDGEVPRERAEQRPYLRHGQERRGAAAPVYLPHGPPLAQGPGAHADFAVQVIEIVLGYVLPFRNHHVATAKQAPLMAERQMHVNRQWLRGLLRRTRQRLAVIGVAERLRPFGSRGITGVAGSRPVILEQQLARDYQARRACARVFLIVQWFSSIPAAYRHSGKSSIICAPPFPAQLYARDARTVYYSD